MSRVSLMIHVGGTSMVVDMADHFRFGNENQLMVCKHCGVVVSDYELHLVHHITVLKDLSVNSAPALQTEGVMPQDVNGDEVGAPKRGPRNLKACRTCGHQHLGIMCGQPWRGNLANPCPCDQPQEQ